jgi:hypothetical protein
MICGGGYLNSWQHLGHEDLFSAFGPLFIPQLAKPRCWLWLILTIFHPAQAQRTNTIISGTHLFIQRRFRDSCDIFWLSGAPSPCFFLSTLLPGVDAQRCFDLPATRWLLIVSANLADQLLTRAYLRKRKCPSEQ